jgi:predicted site-specific integrase-resolvase
MDYTKKGLRRLIGRLCRKEVGRLVVLRQDRLLRFGAEPVFELCRLVGCLGKTMAKFQGEGQTFRSMADSPQPGQPKLR